MTDVTIISVRTRKVLCRDVRLKYFQTISLPFLQGEVLPSSDSCPIAHTSCHWEHIVKQHTDGMYTNERNANEKKKETF